MTYNQTLKAIDAIQNLLNGKTVTEIPYIGRKTVCEGHGMFRETNELCVKYERITNPRIIGKEREELEKTLEMLKESIKEEQEKRYIKARVKRYKKELEELNNRKAYLERYIAEHEI